MLSLHPSIARTRRLSQRVAVLLASIFMVLTGNAQTTLISPTGAGGFQLGADFATNGWTVVNGAAANTWTVGTLPTLFPASNSAFITNGGTHSYLIAPQANSSVVHFYRDVTFPAGETVINLSFNWYAGGESTCDVYQVSWAPTSVTPAAAANFTGCLTTITTPVIAGATVIAAGNLQSGSVQTVNATLPTGAIGNCSAPVTARLIFTWRNDQSGGVQPPVAIDNISLTSSTPILGVTGAGGTFTIDNTLPTGGTNFNSFTAAINDLNIGGVNCGPSTPLVFNVSAGQTFNENPPAITRTGAASSGISFVKFGGGANPVITPPGTAGTADFGLCVSGGDYITFDGIDINASAVTIVEFGYVIRNATATNGAQNVTVRNCAVTMNRANTASMGVVNVMALTPGGGVVPTNISGANHNFLADNITVTNVFGIAIRVESNASFPADNNVIQNCTVGAAYAGTPLPDIGGLVGAPSPTGIYATNVQNVKIRNNTVRNIGSNGTSPSRGIWVNLAQGAGNEVNNNIVRGIRDFNTTSTAAIARGMELLLATSGTHTLTAWNNMVSDITSAYTSTATATRLISGIFLGTGSAGATYNVHHNSVSIDGSASLNTSSCCLEYGSNVAVHNVRNNVLANFTGAQAGVAIHLVIRGTGTNQFGAATSVANNNDLFVANANGFIAQASATNHATIAAYDAAITIPTSNDVNSVSVDPGYVSNVTDLHIAGTPAALNNTGASVGTISDIDGQFRSVPPDMGADEFTTTPCGPATASVLPVQDCANNQFFLDVTITALNGSTSVDVNSDYIGNPGADAGVGLGTHQIGPFPSNTNVQVNLVSTTSAVCNTTVGTYSFDCSTNGQNALTFDGVNDRVDIPASASLSITGTAFTVEAWVYPTAFSTAGEHGNSIVNREGAGGAGFMLRCGGSGQIGFSVGVGTFPVVTAPVGTLVLNQWQHVAGVYDGVNMRIYKDGLQVGSAAQTAAMVNSAAITTAIGNWINGNDRPFAGKIDEVRIWGTTRTVPQLIANKDRWLCGNETGLRAYYRFDQGTAGGNNLAVTTVTDMTVNANNGTATNMALTGPASNWVLGKTGLGACVNCDQPSGSASLAFDCGNNQFFINVVVSALNGASSVNVVSNYPGNPGADFAVGVGTYQIGPFPSTSNVQVTIEHTGNAACNLSLGTYTYDCADFGQNALSFDGVNDGVTCAGAAFDITGTQITLEAWIYPTVFKTNSFDGNIINKEGGNAGYQIRCGAAGILEFVLGTGPGFITVSSPSGTLTLNTWQHVSGTYNGTTAILYKNGVQVASVASALPFITSPNTMRIGDYAVTPGARTFGGKIDEVRVWNVGRTPAEILANYNQQLCTGATGLVAYYQLNQGVDGGNNAGVTTVLDGSGNANNGTAVNFALTGATSNWVQGKTGLAPCPACTSTPTPGTIAGTSPVCANVTTTLTLTGTTYASGLTYQWSYGPVGNPTANPLGTLSSQSTATIPAGTWEVVATVTCTNGGGPATTTAFTFVKNAVPTAVPGSNSPLCTSSPLNLTASSDIGTGFSWTGPNSFTSTQQNPQVSASATTAMAGTYNLTTTANGCSSAATPTVVVVNQGPVVSTPTGTPDPICVGGTSQLNVSATMPGYAVSPITYALQPTAGFTNGPSGDDVLSAALPLPFTLTFFGAPKTSVIINTNGQIGFNYTGSTTTQQRTAQTVPNVGIPNDNISLFWADLNAAVGQITYGTIGTTPNQIFVVSYNNVPFFSGGGTVSGQIHIYETTNVIEMHVTSVTANASFNRTLGVENAAGNDGAAAPGRNNAQWVVSTPEAWRFIANSSTVTWSPTNFLSNPNITNPVASNVTGTTIYTVTAVGSGCTTVSAPFELTVDPPPTATVTSVPNCANSQFSIALDVTSTGTGANVTFTYTVNNGAPITIGPYTDLSVIPNIGPFGANAVVNVTLNHQSTAICNVPFGNIFSGCPQIIDCPETINETYCYGNNDTRSWLFVADVPGEEVKVTFISGLMAPGDVINAYQGTDVNGIPLSGLTGNFPDLATATATTDDQQPNSESMFIVLNTNGSGSCIDGNPSASSWSFQAQCNPECQPIEAAAPVVQLDCPNQQFSLFFEIFFPGDAPSGETTLRYTVNGGPDIDVPGWEAFETGSIGPFALGDAITVLWLHETNPSCNLNQGTVTAPFSSCPNDAPCDAIPVTVNPNYTCTVTSPGHMTGMTPTPGVTTTCAGIVQDVWYRFVATAITHRIVLAGNTTGLSHSIYSGPNCSTLTQMPFGCITGTTSQPNGLTIGATYWIRVSRTTSGTNVFTVCVSAPPPQDIGQNALSCDGTDDRVLVPHTATLDITGTTITLEAWIYPTAWRTNVFEGGVIVKEGGNSGYMLRAGANGTLNFALSRSTPTAGFNELNSVAGALTLNTWQHIAGTYDGTTQRIFINGVQVNSATPASSPIVTTVNQLAIGGWAQDATRCFPGKIDEVHVWNTALSGATIAANMNQQLCGGEPGLRAYYHFNQGVDGGNNAAVTTLFDISGNSNNGTLTTGATGFALSGPTSNWVQGKTGQTPCPPCSATPTPGTITGTSPVCNGVVTSLTLSGASTGSGLTYQWSYGPVGNPTQNPLGTISSQSTASIPVGTWEFVVTVTCTGFGVPAQTPVFTFVKNPVPTATASAGLACLGQTLQLTGTTNIGTTFAWTGPGSFTSTLQNPTRGPLTAAMSGNYTFTATVGGCTSAVSTVAVQVNNPPAITSVTATPSAICEGGNSQLQVNVPPPGIYCTPAYTSTDLADDYLSEVAILNATGTTVLWSRTSGEFLTGGSDLPGYDNQTALSTLTLSAGTTYQIRLTLGGAFAENVAAFMDFSQNASFADVSETLMASTAVAIGGANTVTFTVPAGAYNGSVRLRAALQFSTAASACATAGFGETEDYTVIIAGGVNPPPAYSFSWTGAGAAFLSSTNINNPLFSGAPGGSYPTQVTVTSGVGCASQGSVTVTVNPTPVMACPGNSTVCILTPTFALTGATPAGGTYSGPGVSAGNFNPATAGPGTHTITYTATLGPCSAFCTFQITVDPDTDSDGICNLDDDCPTVFGEIGNICDADAGPGFTLGEINGSCVCQGVTCTQNLTIEIQTDANPGQITWELREQITNVLIQSGTPVAPNGIQTMNTCVPDGCYYLKVTDSGGDGITNGGYILRTAGSPGMRLIDNRRNFTNLPGGPPDVSRIANGEGFCVPIGTTTAPIYTSCDKLDWVSAEYIVCSAAPAVSAVWNAGNTPAEATTGYEFQIFNPNGGYIFNRFRSHDQSDGFAPDNATRACHMKINNWAAAQQIPANVLMNVRIRTRINGVNGNWGAACRFKIDPVRAACPLTKLMDIPGDPNLSCNSTRMWGNGNYIHARPISGATQYQWRFRIDAESFLSIRTTTTYFVQLNWTTFPLQNGKTYQVEVRAFKGGAWCIDTPTPTPGPNWVTWGDVCDLTIDNTPMNGGENFTPEEGAALRMYPNPNRGDQLYLSLDAIEDGVQTVSVDIVDLFGKRVSARTIPVTDGFVNTVLDLEGTLANGMYLVNITAGEQRYTERLVIQR